MQGGAWHSPRPDLPLSPARKHLHHALGMHAPCLLPSPPPPVTRMHLYNDGDARSLHDVADAAAPPVPVGSQTEGGLPVHGASRWKAVLSRS